MKNNSSLMISSIEEILENCRRKAEEEDIWKTSKFRSISKLGCDRVGKAGEQIVSKLLEISEIPSNINGIETKMVGGGSGDGWIFKESETVEIKTARQGNKGETFQHELGEVPWKAKNMMFLDFTPDKIYMTIFPNFTREFYFESGNDKNKKCVDIFPTKSITHRKKCGAFKLDTTIKINDENTISTKTFVFDGTLNSEDEISTFKEYVTKSINLE